MQDARRKRHVSEEIRQNVPAVAADWFHDVQLQGFMRDSTAEPWGGGVSPFLRELGSDRQRDRFHRQHLLSRIIIDWLEKSEADHGKEQRARSENQSNH